MANNTTINSELFQKLLTQSEFALYESSVARSVATVFDAPMNRGKIVSVPYWDTFVATKPGEGVAPAQADVNTTNRDIEMVEHVWYGQVTDMLRDSAEEQVIAAMATQAGSALAASLDNDLIALFGDAGITQSVGANGSDNTVAHLMSAAAQIRAQKYQGPLFAVLHPLQAYGIKIAMTATNSYQNSTQVGSEVLGNYFVGQIAGITILEHSGVPVSGTNAVGAVFAPGAFGVAMRNGITLETERKAAQRATDVVATAVAGVGILRPTLAVKVLGDAVA
jgi:N4-gp56 family major capsid protein